MKIKSLVFTAVLLTAILCSGGLISATDNTALIAQLQAEITQLTTQLQTLLAQQGTTAWCYTFTRNLGFVDSGRAEVSQLHTALQKEDISYGSDSSTAYSEDTSAAVIQFQQKYSITPLSGYVGSATRAKLNALYGCGTTVSTTPSITITSPNGGETYGPNQLMTVKWTTTGSVGNDAIAVYLHFSNDSMCYIGSVSGTNTGYTFTPYGFSCPGLAVGTVPAGNYKVTLFLTGPGGTTGPGGMENYLGQDTSDNYFAVTSLTSTQPSITVTSPNGGESWKIGETHNITWTTENIPSSATGMNILLWDNTNQQNFYDIAMELNPNITSYSWNTALPIGTISTIDGVVPEYLSPGRYKIQVQIGWPNPLDDSPKAGYAVSDYSNNYFTITTSTIPVCTYSYGAWGKCINGTQTRTSNLPLMHGNCTGVPVLSQPCTIVIPACTYSYGLYGACINGTKTRTYSTVPPDSECTGTPVTSQPCPVVDADKYCKPATTALFSWNSSCGSKSTQITQAGVTLATGETIDLIKITKYIADSTKWGAHIVTCPVGTTYRVCVENGNDGSGNYVLLGVKPATTSSNDSQNNLASIINIISRLLLGTK